MNTNTQSIFHRILPFSIHPGPVIKWLLRLILGGTFIVSGTLKLFDPQGFGLVVDAFGILPSQLCFVFGICLSLTEVCAGIGTVLGYRSCYVLTGVMLLGFMGVLIYAIGMGYDIDCGCFGPQDPESKAFVGMKAALLRDLVLLGMTGYLLRKNGNQITHKKGK